MKKIVKILLVLNVLLLFVFAFPSSVSAEALTDGQTIFGDDYTLESGRILDGDLAVIGGVVDIKNEATVKGDVFVLGGVVKINGTIEGSLVAIGSTVTLDENALIKGDLTVPGSHVTRSSGAEVKGDQITSWSIPMQDLDIPMITTPTIVQRDRLVLPVINRIGRFFGMTLLVTALGALLLLVMPKSSERMTEALVAKPWQLLGYGALTGLAFVVATLILTITICFIPVAILLGLAFGLAMLVGWLALGYQFGKLIVEGVFKSHWTAVPTAVIGNLSLYVLSRAIRLIPCLGGFLVMVVSLFGLGMVALTLFGTKTFPRNKEDKENEVIVLNAENVDGEDGQEDQENLPDEEKES